MKPLRETNEASVTRFGAKFLPKCFEIFTQIEAKMTPNSFKDGKNAHCCSFRNLILHSMVAKKQLLGSDYDYFEFFSTLPK